MDRAFASGANGTPPTAPASPSIGYPKSGNPGTGTPATLPGPWWYHMITEELRGVIAAAGLTPDQADITQLLQALPGALASRPEMARSLTANGYQKLPSGLIIQWGQSSVAANSTTTITLPIAFPTAFLQVIPSIRDNVASAGASPFCAAIPLTTSTFSLRSYYSGSGITNSWIAIGY